MTEPRDSHWHTTVDGLVRLFRKALVTLIPVVEDARIPWREGEGYDQWDAIANVLYDKIVAEPLGWGLDAVDTFRLAAYDLRVDHYRDVDFFSVHHQSLPNGASTAFLRFVTADEPLDTVELVVLDSSFQPSERVDRLPVSAVQFNLERFKEGGRRVSVKEVSVPE